MAVTSTAMTTVANFGRLLSISYGQARIRLHSASRKHGTLYVGVTSNLSARIYQHKQGTASAFTRRYKVHRLVYFEEFELITDAIRRENTSMGGRAPGRYAPLKRSIPIGRI